MEVFISWSGPRSGAAASALRNWLPKIINALQPWLSNADIDKGARWTADVAHRLESAKAGIICLTPSNLHADWILFESGALSKTLQNTFVCPLLLGVAPSDVKGPLAQFQATRAAKGDILALLKTLNSALGDKALADTHIEEAFEVWWPRLEAEFAKLPEDESPVTLHRPDRELLEEILGLVRNQSRLAPDTRLDSLRREIILERMTDIILASALNIVKTLSSFSSSNVEMEIETKDHKKYSISIPVATPLDDIDVLVRAQLLRPEEGLGRDPIPAAAI
jgi:hypothetical protein